MFISKNKKTHGRFYLYYTDVSGKRRSITTGTSIKAEAMAFLIAFANKMEELNRTIPLPKPLKNFCELEKHVLLYVSNNMRKGTLNIYKNTCKSFIRIIGSKPLNEITNKDIEYFKSCRLKEVRQSTCNIDLSTLKSTFNIGIKFGWCIYNPVKGISKLRIDQKEKLCLSDEEISKILDISKVSPVMHNIILFGLYTGCRINELLNLQWKNIDLKEGVINIRNKENFKTKTGKIRQIPISKMLNDVINKMIIGNGNVINLYNMEDYIFANRNNKVYSRGTITHSFKQYIRKAGLPEKFHFHCLRHTFITNCIKKGININYVQSLAGHSNLKTTLGYTHIDIEDLKRAIRAIN
jgi:integrase/recombinase XerD